MAEGLLDHRLVGHVEAVQSAAEKLPASASFWSDSLCIQSSRVGLSLMSAGWARMKFSSPFSSATAWVPFIHSVMKPVPLLMVLAPPPSVQV